MAHTLLQFALVLTLATQIVVVTASTLAQDDTCGAGNRFNNSGCTINKYAEVTASDADHCCALCVSNTTCLSWTFHLSPDLVRSRSTPPSPCYLSNEPAVVRGGIHAICGSIPQPCVPVVRPPPSKRVTGMSPSPHIVTLLIDDLGFDDLRSHGISPNASTFTPNVDALLANGVRLDRHHTYMWCSPTRRSFITGRYPVHVSGIQADTSTNLTPLQWTILSEKLKVAGYSSHFIGKGHLGWQTTDHLLVNRGFDTHVGYLGGSESYEWGRSGGSNTSDRNAFTGKHDMWHNDHPGTDVASEIFYSTTFYTQTAVDIITAAATTQAQKPHWIHVAYQAMHGGDFRSNPPAHDNIPNGTGFRDTGYGNALRSLDNGVGNITTALKQAGMWNNTLLIIMADNGGDNPGGTASNYPLLGRKCLSWEGGTRVFALANGGLIPSFRRGGATSQLMHISDWYATACALAGVDSTDDWVDPTTKLTHPIDGVNVWPAISGQAGATTRQWLPTTEKSIVYDTRTTSTPDGHMWKLITNETQAKRFHANGSTYNDTHNPCLESDGDVVVFDCVNTKGERGGGGRKSCYVCSPSQPCLFDVLADPSETNNVANANAEIVKQMMTELAKYQQEYVPPLSANNLACYNGSFNITSHWQGYVGPSYIAKTTSN